ncbi:MAG: SLBB domain-containing protein [bacterium]|nr:SLBB domain-containing protein [bacterium]
MSEADSLVTLAYSQEYRDPDLSIIMQETQGRRVYVLGQVRNPGLYRLPSGGTDVIGAVTMAAGFTDDAARDGTLIVRVTPEGYQIQEVDLDTFGSAQFGGIAALQPSRTTWSMCRGPGRATWPISPRRSWQHRLRDAGCLRPQVHQRRRAGKVLGPCLVRNPV